MIIDLFFAFFEFQPIYNSAYYVNPPTQSWEYEELVREKVDTIAETGAKILIIQAAEEHGYIFYDSNINNDNLIALIHKTDPDSTACQSDDQAPYRPINWSSSPTLDIQFDGVQVVLDQAKVNDMKVLIGTGRNGDKCLMGDIYKHYPNNSLPTRDVHNRMLNNVRISKNRITELHQKFGTHPAFEGFYLSHETGRFNATKNRYYNNVTNWAKSINPDYTVVTSPSLIYASEMQTHSAQLPLLTMDALLYQDRIGAGVRNEAGQPNPVWSFDSNGTIDNYLYNYLTTLRSFHNENTPEMWINNESWRQLSAGVPTVPDSGAEFTKQTIIARQFGPTGMYEGVSQLESKCAKYKFKEYQRGVSNYSTRAKSLLEKFNISANQPIICP